jgi:hypothetical protein
MVAGCQPALEITLVRGEIGVGNADLLKAEFAPPGVDAVGKRGVIDRRG